MTKQGNVVLVVSIEKGTDLPRVSDPELSNKKSYKKLCCGSGFIESRSGISIQGFDDHKNKKMLLKIFLLN